MPEKLVYLTCRHLLDTGRYCQCPAIQDRAFCVHHNRERQRLRNLAKARQVKYDSQLRRLQANPKDVRPEAELDGAIFEAMNFPTLDNTAAIAVAASNVARLYGSGHLSARGTQILANLIRIAEINLRKNHAFENTFQMPQVTEDTSPVQPFGDDEGFVLPEEGPAYRAHQQLKADFAQLDREAEQKMSAAAQAGEPVPQTLSEGHGFNRAGASADDAGASALIPTASAGRDDNSPARSAGTQPARSAHPSAEGSRENAAKRDPGNGKPETGNRAADEANAHRAALGFMDHMFDPHDLPPEIRALPPMERGRAAYRLLRALIEKRKKAAPARMPVPPMGSEGHDFSRADRQRAAGATALPKAEASKAAQPRTAVPHQPETGNAR